MFPSGNIGLKLPKVKIYVPEREHIRQDVLLWTKSTRTGTYALRRCLVSEMYLIGIPVTKVCGPCPAVPDSPSPSDVVAFLSPEAATSRLYRAVHPDPGAKASC
jgi:hypothetical protein